MNKILFVSLTLLGLFPCLAVTQTLPISTGDASTGVEGIISIGPIQGGPTRQGAPDSKPLAKMAFEVKQAGRVIKSFQTDERGEFRVELKPGHYDIARKDWKGAIGFYGPFEVEVTQGKMKKVEWNCDSGLR